MEIKLWENLSVQYADRKVSISPHLRIPQLGKVNIKIGCEERAIKLHYQTRESWPQKFHLQRCSSNSVQESYCPDYDDEKQINLSSGACIFW